MEKSPKKRSVFNWVYGALAITILTALVFLVKISQDNMSEMVREDYYTTGLRQDSLLAQSQKAQSYGLQLDLHLLGECLWLQASIGDSLNRQAWPVDSIPLQFYRPNNSKEDVLLVLRKTQRAAALQACPHVPEHLSQDSVVWIRPATQISAGAWTLGAVLEYPNTAPKDTLRKTWNWIAE